MKRGVKEIEETTDPQLRYRPSPGRWDEAVCPSGMPRRHWRQLAVSVGRMGFEQLTRRWQIGQHLIQANGVTYNVYGDPQGKERPWSLDPIPLVMDPLEWAGLEQAIVQRATLLNRIAADLHGPQRLIQERKLPASLLFGNPNFLRPCFGIEPRGGVFLHSYAVDLARSPNGQWWVISDRTQAPSGMGYALENRLVSARTLAAPFHQCQVRPLNRFFDQFAEGLAALAPRCQGHPRVVLLTPGPHNETYFEQSLLARHWGFPLAEGGDLTVRDDRVFLKTLGGLERVDVILRRVDDSFCDPLELRGNSLLGVPGLLRAIRSGNVAVVNALGTGLLETAAFTGFLPGLCRELMGEPLRMPSVATWWCGQEGPRRFVKENLRDLVIRPSFRRPGLNPEFPSYMDLDARNELMRRIEADPDAYVAQEQVALSTAPVRTSTGFEPRHVVLRAFATWDGTGYSVMPGGLTRVSVETNSPVVSMQLGSGSKDTWVLGGTGHEVLPVGPKPRETKPTAAGIPSRVADNLFWLGRYGERVEAGVRMVRALLPALSGDEDFGQHASVATALELLSGLGFLGDDKSKEASMAAQHWHLSHSLTAIVHDASRNLSIAKNADQLRRVAWPVKERLSHDTWRVLQQLETELATAPPINPDVRLPAQMGLLDRVIVTLSAFSGLLMENTTRSLDWLFLDIGRRLERALQIAELLNASLTRESGDTERAFATLLRIADSSITYRTRYLTELKTRNVLELLLCDEINPRAIGFQLTTLVDHLRLLPGKPGQDLVDAEALLASIRNANLASLAVRDADGNLAALDALLLRLRGGLYDVSKALSDRHFTHLVMAHMIPSL